MVDEQNYRCGEPATEQIASAANFPIPGQADFLDTLLRPAVVRFDNVSPVWVSF